MKTFNQIVSSTFSLPEEDINDNLSSKDIAEWDSMNYLMFIADIEKEFSVSFTMDEVMNAQTLGDIRRVLESRQK
jgi:acyl carrier protein